MSFTDDLQGFTRRTGIRFDQVVRKVTLDMTADLIKLTPVDTGHARSNWFFGANRPTDIDPAMVKNGAPSLQRCAAFVANLQAGGIFYIANNLPYIMSLEYGHSKQAPAGMARITVANWQGRVDQIARSL